MPSCPDWSAADLLWHLATVQRWWAEVVTARPTRPEEIDPPRPESYDELLATFDEWSAELARVLEAADPAQEAWNWSDDHTVGFILRRQAHEALVHRVDAELVAGARTDLDPLLASDGVHECLAVMYGGCPPWGRWEAGEGLVRVDVTDTGEEFWVQFGIFSGTDPDSGTTYADEEDFHVVDAPEDPEVEPDVVIDGTAAALDLWLWSRDGDEDLSVVGDQARPRAVPGDRGVADQLIRRRGQLSRAMLASPWTPPPPDRIGRPAHDAALHAPRRRTHLGARDPARPASQSASGPRRAADLPGTAVTVEGDTGTAGRRRDGRRTGPHVSVERRRGQRPRVRPDRRRAGSRSPTASTPVPATTTVVNESTDGDTGLTVVPRHRRPTPTSAATPPRDGPRGRRETGRRLGDSHDTEKDVIDTPRRG